MKTGSGPTITPTSGPLPAGRTLAALAYQPANDQGQGTNDQLLIFGGRAITRALLADLWAYDLTTAQWSLLKWPENGLILQIMIQ